MIISPRLFGVKGEELFIKNYFYCHYLALNYYYQYFEVIRALGALVQVKVPADQCPTERVLRPALVRQEPLLCSTQRMTSEHQSLKSR